METFESSYQAARAKLFAAGFRGNIHRTVEEVWYPGGSYTHDFITLVANRDGSGPKMENYNTGWFVRYPDITITEATRIGLIDPADATPIVDTPDAPAPLVDLNRFNVRSEVKYYASTVAGLAKPIGSRTELAGNKYMKVAFPRVSFADPTEGWMQI